MVEQDVEFITFDGDTITKSDYRNDIIDHYIQSNYDGLTKITDFNVGSEAYHLADLMASLMLEHREDIDSNYRMSMIHYAEGEFLDNFGDMAGVHREQSSPSVGEVTFTLENAKQSHGRGAVGAHGKEQHGQHHHKEHNGHGGGSQEVAVVKNGQEVHQEGGGHRADQDKGSAAAQLGVGLVGQGPKEGQQEQGQHIVHGHDGAGLGLVQMEGLGQDLGDQTVVHLPECADGQECQTDQNGPFGIEFHGKYHLTINIQENRQNYNQNL